MNNSIIGKLLLTDDNLAKKTIKYLQEIGIGCDEYKKEDINYFRLDEIYIIEFKEKPFILKTLEYNNFFEKQFISIICINENGASFYVAGPGFVDGCIYVPMNNINCIHTITKEQLNRQICFE